MHADLLDWTERSHRRDLLLSDFLGAPPPELRTPSVAPRRPSSLAFAAPVVAPPTERDPRPVAPNQEPTDIDIDIVVEAPTDPNVR